LKTLLVTGDKRRYTNWLTRWSDLTMMEQRSWLEEAYRHVPNWHSAVGRCTLLRDSSIRSCVYFATSWRQLAAAGARAGGHANRALARRLD
jgi:hypothetical protein